MVIQTRRTTVEAFDTFINQPENKDRNFELIGGKIVEVVSNNTSSIIAMLIGGKIVVFVTEKGLGFVTGADGGYIVSGERYIPDVAFTSKAKQSKPVPDAYYPNAPDLAVEVLSPSNEPDDMRIKVVNYLRAGTTVWVVDPDKQQIEVYVPGAAPKALGMDDTLDGGAVLPGFTLPVKDIFPE